ncbi:hypothetical protein [Viridibacillus arvi]|uniref:hypothetical protein n=1 Tax=Viridibacillus arvi TaxID=263475 RepID=UPI0036838F6D
MYKTVITLIAVATMLTATACNSSGTDKNNNEVTEKNEQPVQTEGGQEVLQENEQPKENTNHEEWTLLPEYNKIIEQIDDKDYNFQTVTDNEGKRVLSLIDKNGVEQYKTIFIKNTSRLKIIKLHGEGQIFNEIIDKK